MYHWDPSDYEKNSSAQERAAESVLSGLKLRGDESILDIGCGDGKVTAKIAALVPQGKVTGIDSSPEMIDFARKRIDFPKAKSTHELLDNQRLLKCIWPMPLDRKSLRQNPVHLLSQGTIGFAQLPLHKDSLDHSSPVDLNNRRINQPSRSAHGRT